MGILKCILAIECFKDLFKFSSEKFSINFICLIAWLDLNLVHFLSVFEISAPVVGSSSIPNGVIFRGSGVKVDSGLSA